MEKINYDAIDEIELFANNDEYSYNLIQKTTNGNKYLATREILAEYRSQINSTEYVPRKLNMITFSELVVRLFNQKDD